MNLWENIRFAFAKNIEEWLLDSCENVAALVCSLAFLFFVFRFVVQSILPDLDKHIFDLPTIAAMLGIAFVPELLLVKTLYEYRELRQLEQVTFWKNLYMVNAVNFSLITMVTVIQLIAPIFDITLPSFVGAIALGYRIVAVIFFVVSVRLFEKENGVGFSKRIEELNAKIDDQREKFDQEKQTLLEKFQEEKSFLLRKISEQNEKMNMLKSNFEEEKTKSKRLISEIEKSKEEAMDALPEPLNILAKTKKSCTIEEAIDASGISKTRISNAIKRGEISVSTRNKELLMVASFLQWLKNQPVLMQVVNE